MGRLTTVRDDGPMAEAVSLADNHVRCAEHERRECRGHAMPPHSNPRAAVVPCGYNQTARRELGGSCGCSPVSRDLHPAQIRGGRVWNSIAEDSGVVSRPYWTSGCRTRGSYMTVV